MITQFTLDYFTLVFVSTAGVLQFVFALNGTRGMLFLRNAPRLSSALGALLVVAAFFWFFASEPRNISDTTDGLDGNDQARWFALGAAAAIAVTFLLSSVINHRWAAEPGESPGGIEAMRQTTFLKAVGHRLASLWSRARVWMQR